MTDTMVEICKYCRDRCQVEKGHVLLIEGEPYHQVCFDIQARPIHSNSLRDMIEEWSDLPGEWPRDREALASGLIHFVEEVWNPNVSHRG